MSITGECFCGAVKYRVSGKLWDARSCHCSRCRKAFSSQASAMASVEPSEFEWLTGKDLLTSYINKDAIGLQFCKNCGSTLCVIVQGEVRGITLGCINGDPEVKLGMHIYTGSKASWEKIPEGTPMFKEGPY